METAFDNCNNADLNNPVQNIIQNANTEFKMDKSNDIFKTDNPFNDGMNNFMPIGDTNSMHTNLDPPGNIQKDLPECEQIYQYGDEILESKVTEKRPFDGDLGPETSVDVPDDVIMTTESSEENLSKSSLSHSKEALPLSDNLNPFDAKNSLTDLETSEFQMQDDTKTCTTPSDNLLDTPVDPASLDDVKQILPSDCVQTNGIHSEEDRLAEDLVHDELPIANEFIQDNKHERAYFNEFEREDKVQDDFINNFIDDKSKKELGDDIQNIHNLSSDIQEPMFVEQVKNEEQLIIETSDDNKHVEQDVSVKEIVKHFEDEKDVKSPIDATCDENTLELHASGTLLQDVDYESNTFDTYAHNEQLEKETEKETLSDQTAHIEVHSSDFTTDEIARQHENKLIEKFEEISFDEKNMQFDDEDDHIPPMQLNSSDSVHEADENTHPIEDLDDHIHPIQLDSSNSLHGAGNKMPLIEEDEGDQISPIQLDSSDFLHEADDKTHPIEEVVQQLQDELIPQMQQKEDIEVHDDQFPSIKQEQISEFQQHISQTEQNPFLQEIEHENKPIIEQNETFAELDQIKDILGCVVEKADHTKTEKIQDVDEIALEKIVEAVVSDVDVNKEAPVAETIFQHTALESCEESEDEWNYMRLKGEGEKEVPKVEIEEVASPAELKSIPEKLHSHELEGEVESQEPSITSVEESKDNTTTPSVEPSGDTLEISESQLDNLDQEVSDMTSQLNPEAKEFIPTNQSPVHFELTNGIPPIAAARHIAADDVVAQSPRKGAYSMEQIVVPSEVEFESEIVHCPSEIQASPEQNELYQELNLKEAMHGSEKEEQISDEGYDYNMPTNLDSVGMKESIYIESAFDKEQDFMNTVQPLPTESDELLDTSMDIPIVPDTSLNEISTDNYSDLNKSFETETIHQVKTPSPEELVNQITKNVDLLGLSESPVQTSAEEAGNDETLPLADISQKETSEPITSVLVEHIASIPVQSTTPISIERQIPAPVTEHAESTVEIKKKEEKIEKAVAEKVEATRPSIKVPEAKKDVKAKASLSSAPKKVSSSTSAASTDASKPKTSHAISKTKTTTTAAAPPRPRTVPLASKTLTEKKATAPSAAAAARPKVDARSTLTTGIKKTTTTAAPKTKPDEQTKVGVKQSLSKTGVTSKPPITSRTSSSTSTTSKTRTTAQTTNVTTTKTPSTRVALSATAKSATTTKPATSPRGTLTSTLRKTEALKSPPGATKPTAPKTTTSLAPTRTSSTTKQTKPVTAATARTSSTTLNSSPTAKKLAPSSRPASATQKKTPVKKYSMSPVKRMPVVAAADENKTKTPESNEVKLNGTAIEAAEKTDSKQ